MNKDTKSTQQWKKVEVMIFYQQRTAVFNEHITVSPHNEHM